MAERKAWVSPYAHLGSPGMARRFVEVAAPSVAENRGETKIGIKSQAVEILVSAERRLEHLAEPKRRGRPSSGEPWVAVGMSRAAWFRERKRALADLP
jgi:hypothetical protein